MRSIGPAWAVLAGLLPSLLPAQTPLDTYADAFIQRSGRTAPKVDCTITVRDGDRSAYFVELVITNPPARARLVIPEWAPGSYRLMESAKNIRDVAALTPGGTPLPITADSGNGWTLPAHRASAARLTDLPIVTEKMRRIRAGIVGGGGR